MIKQDIMVTCCFAVLVSLFLWWQHLRFALRKLKVQVLAAQSCLIPCNLMDCDPSGSSSHGILLARILEWVAIPFFWPRDGYWVSRIALRFFTSWAQLDAVWRSCQLSCLDRLHSKDVHPGALRFCIILMFWALGPFLSILSIGFSLISFFKEIYYYLFYFY